MFSPSEVSTSDSEDLDEMERMRKDYIEALKELKRLQVKFITISVCVNMQVVRAVFNLIVFKERILDATKEQVNYKIYKLFKVVFCL